MALVALLAIARAAPGLTPAVALDHKLEPRQIHIRAIRDGRMQYFDPQRVLRTAPLDRFLRIRFPGESRADEAPSGADKQRIRVELTDGQRLRGRWLARAGEGKSLRLRHPLLGTLAIPLGRLRSLTVGGRPIEPRSGRDRARLANGDTIKGIAVAFAGKGLRLERLDGGGTLRLPRGRLRAVAFANERTKPKGAIVALRSGERVALRALRLREGRVSGRPSLTDERVRVPLGRVRRIELPGAANRLLRLDALETAVAGGGSVFGAPWPPTRSRGGGLCLHAPVTVRVALPSDAERFAARFRLEGGAGLTAWHRRWADVRVVLAVDGERVAERRLRPGENRAAEINAPLDGDVLRIRLIPGVNGPLMDRVRLHDAIVLRARSGQ